RLTLSFPADRYGKMTLMRIGVIDVGANTVRLLVASRDGSGIIDVHGDRVQLGLGEEIAACGRIPPAKIAAAGEAVRAQATTARRLGATHVEVVVTSPGRQAENADELIEALQDGADCKVTVLTAEDEARYAYAGALAAARGLPESVGVCDVGGGSMQIVVGTTAAGPVWARSFELGSLRLTRLVDAGDPPTLSDVARMRAAVREGLADLVCPLPQRALATGGTARALRKLVGSLLGPDELEDALAVVGTTSVRQLVKRHGLSRARARTVAAGTVVLDEVQRRFGVPFHVVDGGLREGVVLSLLASLPAAA
ncbi:MAG: exopolyphosphatase / guanosine-5-triphosphate,3-diphosphate pyrophosphatase, partial [Gaiellaceae bacterium]|nr:exopolyphosphatase / guanosine-5-triphosphate,3-diphosphate pyrophosphatase [Gaiellaceae bacterium]